MAIINVTEENFDELLEQHDLIVFDFWAPWCAPCKGFSQVCVELSETNPDVAFLAINIEDQKALADEFAVQSVPWVMLMRSRVVLYADSGALSKSSLQELIDQARAMDAAALQAAQDQ